MADKASFAFGGSFTAVGLGMLTAGVVLFFQARLSGDLITLPIFGFGLAATGVIVIIVEIRKLKKEDTLTARINQARKESAAGFPPEVNSSFERKYKYTRLIINKGGAFFACMMGLLFMVFPITVSLIYRETEDFVKLLMGSSIFIFVIHSQERVRSQYGSKNFHKYFLNIHGTLIHREDPKKDIKVRIGSRPYDEYFTKELGSQKVAKLANELSVPFRMF